MKKRFILALLPETRISEQLQNLSQKLCKEHKGYVLGVNSAAHNSVLQFEEDEDVAVGLWQGFSHLPKTPKVLAKRFYTDPMSDGSAIYFGMGISLNEELMSFQQKALEKTGENSFFNKVGVSYFPHYTLGLIKIPGKLEIEITEDISPLPLHECRLAFGTAGPDWQFDNIMFTRDY